MGPGVILIVNGEEPVVGKPQASPLPKTVGALACVEILGQTMLDRAIERFFNPGPAAVTVLLNSPCASPTVQGGNGSLRVESVNNVWTAAAEVLKDYARSGIACAVVAKAQVYGEYEFPDLFQFHCGSGRKITTVCDSAGPLGIWVAKCTAELDESLFTMNQKVDENSFFVWNYTNRLANAADLRRLVVDSLRGACAIRPSGMEIRPGVFVESSAQIHKRARIVAPAFIGRGTRICEDVLVTRCSNIESDCYIDCGTAIEDSSVFSNTYVGICLDVSHSIVRSNLLLNVERNVELEISDESMVRDNAAAGKHTLAEPLVRA